MKGGREGGREDGKEGGGVVSSFPHLPDPLLLTCRKWSNSHDLSRMSSGAKSLVPRGGLTSISFEEEEEEEEEESAAGEWPEGGPEADGDRDSADGCLLTGVEAVTYGITSAFTVTADGPDASFPVAAAVTPRLTAMG